MIRTYSIFFLSLLMFLESSAQSKTVKIKELIDEDLNIVNAAYSNGIWTFYGYGKADTIVSRAVKFGSTDVFALGKTSWWPTLSIITIPFKVRPKAAGLPQNAQLGLTNAGVSLNLWNRKLTRYFNSGKTSNHSFGIGALFAPTVEELTPENTNPDLPVKSKQLFLSLGLSLTYTYNDLTFAFVPAGFDFPTTTDGRKFVYSKRRWWGFGIGISSKLLGF
jgi:hypothetical protein